MDSNEPTGYLLDVSPSDDFFEQIVGVQNFASAGVGGGLAGRVPELMMLQLGFGQGAGHMEAAIGGGAFHVPVFRSGLSLDQGEGRGFFDPEVCSGSGKLFQGEVVNQIGLPVKNVFHDQPAMQPVPRALHPPASRPRIRAKRGQATDPHSIAERLRRARIAEKVRALQELVPSVNTSDRGAMIDEIVDYVKFLRQQVKVLSMSRLVTDIPVSSSIGDKMSEGSATRMDWEKWADDGTERQATKLMEENVGAAMQFLHSKALCVMPLSLFVATFHSQPPDASSAVLGSHTTLLPI